MPSQGSRLACPSADAARPHRPLPGRPRAQGTSHGGSWGLGWERAPTQSPKGVCASQEQSPVWGEGGAGGQAPACRPWSREWGGSAAPPSGGARWGPTQVTSALQGQKAGGKGDGGGVGSAEMGMTGLCGFGAPRLGREVGGGPALDHQKPPSSGAQPCPGGGDGPLGVRQ